MSEAAGYQKKQDKPYTNISIVRMLTLIHIRCPTLSSVACSGMITSGLKEDRLTDDSKLYQVEEFYYNS